ncbi:hypothetical protein [Alienimonas californiensis]|uniref:hypothetical protein n=1 Tax=Alienimonas californiensis TaxID=2527989 RepID=UPI0011A1FF0A|nr:hypothetical protein [Alienimonas californiensis]
MLQKLAGAFSGGTPPKRPSPPVQEVEEQGERPAEHKRDPGDDGLLRQHLLTVEREETDEGYAIGQQYEGVSDVQQLTRELGMINTSSPAKRPRSKLNVHHQNGRPPVLKDVSKIRRRNSVYATDAPNRR